MWFFALIVVLLVGAVAVVASGRWGAMGEAYDDRPEVLVPARHALTADDIESSRFGIGVRGYRMDEVDALLERVAREVAERDRRIADLERAGTPADRGPENTGSTEVIPRPRSAQGPDAAPDRTTGERPTPDQPATRRPTEYGTTEYGTGEDRPASRRAVPDHATPDQPPRDGLPRDQATRDQATWDQAAQDQAAQDQAARGQATADGSAVRRQSR